MTTINKDLTKAVAISKLKALLDVEMETTNNMDPFTYPMRLTMIFTRLVSTRNGVYTRATKFLIPKIADRTVSVWDCTRLVAQILDKRYMESTGTVHLQYVGQVMDTLSTALYGLPGRLIHGDAPDASYHK